MKSKIEVGKSYLFSGGGDESQKIFIDNTVSHFKIEPSDVIEFEPDEGVAQLRKVIAGVAMKPHSSLCRLLIIRRGDLLNSEQANALLKTIEEPPSYVLIVILCAVSARVLPTIKSRCIRIQGESTSLRVDDSLFLRLLELDFNQFLAEIKNIESGQIPDMLNLSLEVMKRRGLSTENVGMYEKIAETYLRLSSTNSNPRLALENIYIWNKTRQEK